MQLLQTISAQVRKFHAWLDRRGWFGALVGGAGLGVGLGALALLGIGGWLGQGLCLLVLVLAFFAGRNAEPVLVGAPEPPVGKPP